uniref:L1 transposable element RRM domain-containing protein n=1 Tax=Myotis myotis TaxID=51298 RepID=A0A7J7YDI3_MYOMY|nr:hypothetical protein mMyoMyo1_010999 [Myotis myotis]
MPRQRNRTQTTESEESKLLDIEFKTTLLRSLKNCLEATDKFNKALEKTGETADKCSEIFKKTCETTDKCSEILKKSNETLDVVIKNQLEIKHTLTEIKNIIQTPNSRPEGCKNQVNDLEYEEAKNNQPEKQNEKRIKKYEDSVRNLWDSFKLTNIRFIRVPEDEREQDIENLFEEIMTENFPLLVKEIDFQVQEVHRTPNKMNPKRTTPRHIIIKMPRAKDRDNPKSSKRKKVSYLQGSTHTTVS